MERKNPLAVVEAFTRAFQPGEGPHLLVKSINGHHRVNELERLRAVAAAPAGCHRPRCVPGARAQIALTASCDCYVSLHRSEGFGLTMAEAMSHGKPVIATGYGGNLDFMTQENSYLVPYELVAVGQDARPYPSTAMWAEPDLMRLPG